MNWLGISLIDWLVLSAYFLLVGAVGVWSFFKVKNVADYFMGGRRFGKIFMMFFAFGAGTSSEQAISVVAGTWRVGLAGIWWQFLWLWATPFYWIVAPVMRRMRALTTSDFFESRYDSSTATLYSLFGIIIAITFMAGGLYGGGKMINALTGGELEAVAERANIEVPEMEWDAKEWEINTGWRRVRGYEFAIVAMTILFVIYGMAGGLGAAIVTDFIQGVLTVVFSFLLLPFVFREIGGFGSLRSFGEIKEGMFNMVATAETASKMGAEPLDIFHILMISITALTGIVVQPHIMGVCGAGKTELEGRFGFTFGNFLKRFCTIAWTFTGLACVVWYLTPEFSPLEQSVRESLTPASSSVAAPGKLAYDPELDTEFADELFGRAAFDILPTIMPGLIGLLMASLLAAVMSSSDAQMIVSSGLFTENIYRRFLIKGRSEKHYVWVGRIAGLIIVALALVLQATFTDVIHALKVIIQVPAAIGISLWIGIVWRGWTVAAVWVSTFTAMVVWGIAAFFPYQIAAVPGTDFMLVQGQVTQVAYKWQMLFVLLAGVGSGLVVSWISPRVSTEKLDHFFTLLRTPIRPGEVVEAPCTLPENRLPMVPKLINHPDIELLRPSPLGLGGFVGAWACVGLIIWLTQWLADNA